MVYRSRARPRLAPSSPAAVLVRRPSPIGLTAADLFAGGKVLKGGLRVYVNQALSPVLVALRPQHALDAVPEAYHNPAASLVGGPLHLPRSRPRGPGGPRQTILA
jgi:hypothetical protein